MPSLVDRQGSHDADRQWRALEPDDLAHAHAVMGARWERLRGKRIFVTGGTGFVGKWMLSTLLDAERRLDLQCQVAVLTRDASAFRARSPHLALHPRVTLLSGDVQDLAGAGQAHDLVVHAATDAIEGGSALDTFDTCVQGTRRALDFALGAGATDFLLVSSGAVYGRQPVDLPALDEEFSGAPDPLDPGSAYGQGKRAAEWLAGAYAQQHEMRVKVARCFAFVGPYLPLDRHFAVGNFIRDAAAGRPIVIHGDGTPLRSYLHASDMSAWLWALVVDGRTGTAYNVGGDEAVSIVDLARLVADAMLSTAGVEVKRQPLPNVKPSRYVPDTRRVRAELQLPDTWTLRVAIQRAAQWHRDVLR